VQKEAARLLLGFDWVRFLKKGGFVKGSLQMESIFGPSDAYEQLEVK